MAMKQKKEKLQHEKTHIVFASALTVQAGKGKEKSWHD